MINLHSSNTQMLDELFRDETKAFYWLVKKFGGEKSYEKMRSNILTTATKLKKDVFTECIEYNSPEGNRWMVYECATYYPEAKASNTKPYAFCYYETNGSIGVFVPVQISGSKRNAVVIFTSHFFMRLSERLGARFEKPEMLRRFYNYVPKMLLEYHGKDNSILVRLPDAIGLGVKREGDGIVFEVRTILSDTQLSNGQMRKTEKLREGAEKISHEPLDIAHIRFKKMNMNKDNLINEMDRMAQHYQILGEKGDAIRNRMDIYMWIGVLLQNLGYTNGEDKNFWLNFGTVNRNLLLDYANSGQRSIESFLDLCTTCLREVKLKKLQRDKARQILKELGAIGKGDVLITAKQAVNMSF